MSPEMRDKYLEIIRSFSLAKKLQITLDFCDLVRDMMAAGIRAEHPGISEEEVRREIIMRTLPPDLVHKVYGW
jgi:hypothetical protein